VKQYQQQSGDVPKGSCKSNLLGTDGIASRMFFIIIFYDMETEIRFLQESGVLRKDMTCPKCQPEMKLYKYEAGIDKFRWYCGSKGTQGRCETARSIRHSSWFTRSKLTLLEVMLVTYDTLQKVPAKAIRKKYQLGTEATCDWINFCREVMLRLDQLLQGSNAATGSTFAGK
jgi:ribosomal protein S27AE